MARVIIHMSFEEFVRDVESAFNRVVHERETIIIEKGEGEAVVVEVAPSVGVGDTNKELKRNTEEERRAFLASAGGWNGLVDTDELVENIYESRRIATRPPVKL